MAIYSKGSLYASDQNSTTIHYVLQEGYCNTRCQHCYMLSQNEKRMKRDFETARLDVMKLIKQGYKVDFRGTELLLDPEFLELFPMVGQDYVQTNGLELLKNSELFFILKKFGIKKIMLTYPGLPENMVGFQKAQAEEAIKRSISNGFRTILDYIVTSEVVKSFKHDGEFFEKLIKNLICIGANELRFVRLISLSNKVTHLIPTASDMEIIAAESVRLEARYKNIMDVTRSGQLGLYNLRRSLKETFLGIKVALPEESGVMDCPAGKKLFVIDVDNSIYPCLYLMSKNFRMGEFLGGIIHIQKSELAPGGIHLNDCPATLICNKK